MQRLLIIILLPLLALASCKSTGGGNEYSDHPLCGGYSEWRKVEAADSAIYYPAVEAFLATKEVCGPQGCSVPEEYRGLADAKATQVCTQVVAGLNYRFIADDFVVTVFQPLPGRGEAEVSGVEKQKK